MTFEEFVKEMKQKRLTGSWYQFVGIVDGKSVRLKGYKTYLQIYEIDGIRYGGRMDISVKEFNEELKIPFNKGV